MHSINTGFDWVTAFSRALLTALYTANTSLPSTRIVSMPYAGPRDAEK